MSRRKKPKIDPWTEGLTHDSVWKYTEHPFRWAWVILGKFKPLYVLAIALDLVYAVMSVVPATITGNIVDEVFSVNGMDADLTRRLIRMVIMLVAVPLSRSLIAVMFRYIFEVTSQNSLLRLRSGLYKHLQDMDPKFYSNTPPGDIMAKMTGDVEVVRHYLAWTLFFTIEQIFIFVFGCVYLITINWKLALATMLLTPVILVLTNRMKGKIREIWAAIRRQFEKLNSVVQQGISGNRVIKAFVRQPYETERFEAENMEWANANLRHVAVFRKYLPVLDGLANFLSVLVILVGGMLVILGPENGGMTLGSLVTFNGLLFVLNNPMRLIGQQVNEIQRFSASSEKIMSLLLTTTDIQNGENPKPTRTGGGRGAEVEFRSVTFGYEGKSGPITLRDISFRAGRGETVGIIGATGSGKSTLVNMIPRFFDPLKGSVLVDGVDLRECDLNELRSRIGMVAQDVFLFSDTIEGNIAFGVPDTPMENVEKCARAAAAHDFILHTSEGYDTIVGERGVGLSGGQRQRISLARALAVDPDILILDDTTSAVDMETEQEIQTALQEFFSDRTVFVIAHRISSVRRADQILVLDDGRIAESGTHEQLMALRGIYYDVYMTQTGFESDEEIEMVRSWKEAKTR